MAIRAQAADGTLHEFPEGTDQGVVDKVMKEYAASHRPPVAPPSERDPIARAPQRESLLSAFERGASEGWGTAPEPGTFMGAAAMQPVSTILRGASALTRGAQEAVASTGRLGRDIAALPEAFMGSPGSAHVPAVGESASVASEVLFPGASRATSGTLEGRAADVVSRAFEKTRKGSSATALDIIDQISAAREAGQPLTLSDVGGKPLRRLADTVYRSGGEPAAHMEKFYKGRGADLTLDHLNTVAGERIEKAVGANIGVGSYRQAVKDQIAERSLRARPLWEEAMAGGSTAPLESQFETVFNEASRAEQEAARTLNSARSELTQASGRQVSPYNVYTASGANRFARESQTKVKAAEDALAKAREDVDAARTRLRQAQDDGTANAPGAVWSPRLQEFLNLPKWQEGIRRGLAMERQDAVTEGRAFNPSEYAIIGADEAGEPIVGAVPTTKLLQVAREGIAAMVDDMRDPLTGSLTKAGRSLWLNLKAFEQEGYRLNPAWKTANDAWSGDSASIRALQLGKKIFSMPQEDLVADFEAMSDSDQNLFRLSAASKAVGDVRKTPLSADPSKRVINSPDELQRLRVLFPDSGEFKKFVDFIDRERTMFETARSVTGGSQTAERLTSDVGIGADLARGAGHLLTGRGLAAIAPLMRATKGLGLRQNPKLNLEVAKILTDPNVSLADIAEQSQPLLGALRRSSPGALRVGPRGVVEMLQQSEGYQ